MGHSRIRTASALGQGAREVARAWRYLLGAHAWNFALALCLAVLVQDAVRASLGSSLAGDRMKDSWDSLWYASFSTHTNGVVVTFRPSVSGAGAVLDALDTFLDGFGGLFNGGAEASLWPMLAVYWLSWSFLSGGFVSLFVAPDREVGFMSRAARLFPRFLTISLAGFAGYALILGWMRRGADAYVASRLRDVSDERVHFAWTLGEYVALWTLVMIVNVAVDYAKVFAARTADQPWSPRTMLAVLGRSSRFVGRHVLGVFALYLLTGLLGLFLMGLYLSIVPGALDSTSTAILGTFVIGQAYVLCRIAIRCLFYAGEAALTAPVPGASLSISQVRVA